MTKGKDQNSRGKKFQDRQPGEKRPRTVKGSNENKPTRKDKPSGFGTRRSSGDDRPFGTRKPSGFGTDSPRGRKPSGFGTDRRSPRSEGDDRAPRGRKPSGFGTDRRSPRPEGDDRAPRGRKPSGFGTERRSFRPEGDDRGPRGRKPSGFDTERRGPRPEGDDRSPRGRKPSGFGTERRGPRPEGDDRNTRGRKPSGFNPDIRTRNDESDDRAPRGRKPAFRPGTGDAGDRRSARPVRSGSGFKREYNQEEPEKRRTAKPRSEKPAGRFKKEDKLKKSTRLGASKNFKGSRRKHEDTGKGLENANLLQGEEVRLNRYIANSGICSRREADVMIEQGLVQVNGKVVTELGVKVMPGDEVKVDGRRITPEKPVYILLNKPKGYITSTADPEGRATVMDLIDLPGKERIYPIGRLDRNTTGVLLLTNDGELAQKLMHPSFEIKKVYRVKLDQKPSKDHMLAWVNGVELEDGFMAFEQCGFVDPEDDTILGVEIHSGRNRIVRRMFEHYKYEVLALDRVLLGEFDHVKLGRGKWRFLNDKETRYVEKLKRVRSGKKPS